MNLRIERVLFILKRRQDYDGYKHSQIGLSTGLYNSALYMSDMLNNNRIESKVVVVVDNNSIDKEVHLFKPTHVIIETLWVVPEKFEILNKYSKCLSTMYVVAWEIHEPQRNYPSITLPPSSSDE